MSTPNKNLAASSHITKIGVLVAGAIALFGCVSHAAAQDFYAGKTINLYIGQDPGGGYDTYGRLVGRHMGKYIPGKPAIVAQNMPGAGGLKVASYTYRAAAKDGTALTIAAEAIALEQALGNSVADYDVTKLTWIGRVSASASIFFTRGDSRVKTIADARNQEAVFGSSGIAGITGYTPKALNTLAGTKFKIVTGYKGSADVMLALERGEVDGGYALWPELKTQRPELMEPGKINILYIVAGQRAADLPNVPTTEELGQSQDGKAILKLLASTAVVGRSIFSTPGLVSARVGELRKAFDQMIEDPSFKAEADKSGLKIDPLNGQALQDAVGSVMDTPAALVEEAKKARS